MFTRIKHIILLAFDLLFIGVVFSVCVLLPFITELSSNLSPEALEVYYEYMNYDDTVKDLPALWRLLGIVRIGFVEAKVHGFESYMNAEFFKSVYKVAAGVAAFFFLWDNIRLTLRLVLELEQGIEPVIIVKDIFINGEYSHTVHEIAGLGFGLGLLLVIPFGIVIFSFLTPIRIVVNILGHIIGIIIGDLTETISLKGFSVTGYLLKVFASYAVFTEILYHSDIKILIAGIISFVVGFVLSGFGIL